MRKLSRHLAEDAVDALSAAFAAGGKVNAEPSAYQMAASALGIAKATLATRVHIAKRDFGLEPTIPEISQKTVNEDAIRAQERIKDKDEIKRLTRQLKGLHQRALDDAAIREILETVARAEVAPPAWLETNKEKGSNLPEVPMTIWSDWHIGEKVEADEVNGINEFSLDIAEKRVQRLVESTIDLCKNHGPKNQPGIVVNLLGDFVSGGLHPELVKTDEEESLPSVLRARDLLVAGLEKLLTHFPKIYCPCAAGNHGRQTQKPEFKRYVYKNFDWLIIELLKRHFINDRRIVFDLRPSNEVHFKVFGLRFLAMHGDMMGVKGGDGIIGAIGPIMRGEIKTSRQASTFNNDYDVLLMGHWHQQLWLPRAIVANSLKGFDEFAAKALRAVPSIPSQPLWFVHPQRGITSRWDVRVDELAAAQTEWVSWK